MVWECPCWAPASPGRPPSYRPNSGILVLQAWSLLQLPLQILHPRMVWHPAGDYRTAAIYTEVAVRPSPGGGRVNTRRLLPTVPLAHRLTRYPFIGLARTPLGSCVRYADKHIVTSAEALV